MVIRQKGQSQNGVTRKQSTPNFLNRHFLPPDMYTCLRKFGGVCLVKQVLTLALLLYYQRFYKLNSNSRAAICVTYKLIIKSKKAVPNKQALIPSTSKPQFFLEGKNHFLKLWKSLNFLKIVFYCCRFLVIGIHCFLCVVSFT